MAPVVFSPHTFVYVFVIQIKNRSGQHRHGDENLNKERFREPCIVVLGP